MLQSPSLEFCCGYYTVFSFSCHLFLVFDVMAYLTHLHAQIGLLELYGMC